MLNRLVTIVACAFVFAALPGSTAAQGSREDRMLEFAGTHTVITQQIAKEALLVALSIDREQNLRRLQASRNRFDRVLRGLRDGDDALGLPAAVEPALLAELDRADGLWKEMDLEIRAGLAAGRFNADQLDRITDHSISLLETLNSAMAVRADLRGGQYFSMLLVAIELSDRQRTLVEQ